MNIICTGKIKVSGESIFNLDNVYNLIIFVDKEKDKKVHKEIEIDGESKIQAVVYAPYSEIKINGKSKAVGHFFGIKSELNGQSTLEIPHKSIPAGKIVSVSPIRVYSSPAFQFGEVYSYPNPAKLINPKIHIECGVADRIEIKIAPNVKIEITKGSVAAMIGKEE